MSYKTEFKLLIRVKIRLGFYLDDGEKSFFGEDAPTQDKRLRQYDIRPDLTVEPTDDCRRHMRNYGLVWQTDNEGFFIGIEVHPNGNKVVKPLPEGFRLAFALKMKNPNFSSFTNQRLAPLDIPFRYYFTNSDAGKKAYPALSAATLSLATLQTHLGRGRIVEMGEYCKRISSSPISQALVSTIDGTDIKLWKDKIKYRFVHTGDRLALPKSFIVANISALDAELKSADGKVSMRKIGVAGTPSSVQLDFSTFKRPDPTTKKDAEYPLPDGPYQLVLSGDVQWDNPMNKPAAMPTVFLFDALADSSVWSIVEIVHEPGLPAGFEIQQADNTLPTKVPELEIRLASRLTYWNYFGKSIPKIVPQTVHALTKIRYQAVEDGNNYTSPDTTSIGFDQGIKRFVSNIYL